jgi:hypothetical protein
LTTCKKKKLKKLKAHIALPSVNQHYLYGENIYFFRFKMKKG